MRNFLSWLGLALVSSGFYILLTITATAPGFPLDDGWIHQVFARNLAQRLEFSYNPGFRVAGSTSPLWTFLLVPGHWLPDFYTGWTYILGILFLALTAGESFRLTQYLTGQVRLAWAAALFTIFEWRLAWAGASGMEILLFAWGTLFFMRLYCQLSLEVEAAKEIKNQKILWLGLLGGGLAFIRPEGIFLAVLAGLELWLKAWRSSTNSAKASWLLFGTGGIISAFPYFAFNYQLSGSILPNTLGAKANYYAGTAVLEYVWNALFQLLLAGPLFGLLPGLLLALFTIRRSGLDWRPLVWVGLLIALYAWRLPVTYHHARYLMPLIPLLGVYGVVGTSQILIWLRARKLPVVARTLPVLLGLAVLVGWFNGAAAYRFDVKYINDEHVAAGKWLAQNTPPETLIATHDIGAITFFSQRRLVDTAGLVSPEFVPIVRDQSAILKLVKEKQVNYFALLPTWYPEINAELEKTALKVFEPPETYLQQFGEQNLVIFKLR